MPSTWIISVLFQLMCYTGLSYITMPASWIPSPDIKAFSVTFVNNIGGTVYSDSSKTSVMVPFPAGITFTVPPKTTLAIIRYQAADDLTSGNIVMNSNPSGATTTHFQMSHDVSSDAWVVSYRIITRTASFPYHFNLFSNYNPLSGQSVTSLSSFTSQKDYSAQASSEGYSITTFTPRSGSDYSNNVVVLFISCFIYAGTAPFAQSLQAHASAFNATHFTFNIIFGVKGSYTKYHFNMIVYDKDQLESTGQFKLHYDHVNFTDSAGGEYPVPAQCQSAAIMGWTDLITSSANHYMNFDLTFSNLTVPVGAVDYGITMQPSNPVPVVATTDTIGISLFYLSYMTCTNSSYFYVDFVNFTCVQCTIISNCLQCSNGTQCTVCQSGYFVNSTGGCQLYNCGITHCSLCLNSTDCYQCDYGSSYAVNATGGCSLCDNNLNLFINLTSPLKQCLNCSQVSCGPACSIGQYLQVTNLTCMNCSLAIQYCLQCYFDGQCTVCQPGYFVNSSLQCQIIVCSGVPNCNICLNTTACYQCNYTGSFALDSLLQCPLCDNSLNMFINMSSPLKECLNCSQVSCGIACTLGQYLQVMSQTCLNCSIAITHCINCYYSGHCTACETGYFVNVSLLCEKINCGIAYCDLCLNVTACHQCDYTASYYLDNTLGCSFCDNNLNMYINQSSALKECLNCSQIYCQFLSSIQFTSISKQGCNGFTLILHDGTLTLSRVQATAKFVSPSCLSIILIQSQSSAYFNIHAVYNCDIASKSITLEVVGRSIHFEYEPTIPALYYNEDQCKIQANTKKVYTAYTWTSYSVLLISVFSGKIVGLQLFGILQLSYFVLAQHSFLNLYLSPLMDFKLFNGLNIQLVQEQSEIPKIMQQMGVFSNFINNFNIMLMVFYGYLVLLVVCNIVVSIFSNQLTQVFFRRALVQGMVTLTLFNCFNFSFAAGVHWKYANANDDQFYTLGFALSLFTLAIITVVLIMTILASKELLGQFRTKLKGFPSQLFIPLTVMYRIALGVFCALKNDYQYSTIWILGLSLCFTMYVIVNLPFNSVHQNYRTSLIQVTIIVILLTADYYRTMKSSTAFDVKGRIYFPAILEIAMIGACVAVSCAILIYDVVSIIRKCSKSKNNRKVSLDTSESDNQVSTQQNI